MESGDSGAARGDAGADPDATRGAQFFSELLWRGVLANQWSVDGLTAKARSIRNVGAVVLSVLVLGLVGLGRFLDWDVASLAGFSALPYWVLPAFGLVGIGSTVASMGFATRALGALDVYTPVSRGNFTAGGRDGPVRRRMLDECARSPADVALRMNEAYIQRIDDLARSMRRMGWMVRAGQWTHFAGLSCIGVASMLVLGGMVAAPPMP